MDKVYYTPWQHNFSKKYLIIISTDGKPIAEIHQSSSKFYKCDILDDAAYYRMRGLGLDFQSYHLSLDGCKEMIEKSLTAIGYHMIDTKLVSLV